MSKSFELLDLMWRATHERFGIWIRTDNAEGLRAHIYKLRNQHPGNFEALSVIRTRDDRLWILNREGGKEIDDEKERES